MYFSILIPVYNVEVYLKECINSVLQQTFQDYEIVLVDDGSVDSSPEICDCFFECYPNKIKVIHKKNEGVVLARNEAIKQASGDVVIFLDSDDCLRNDALMLIHETFEKHQCDMVIYNYSKDPDFCKPCANVPFMSDKPLENEEKKQLYKLLCSVSCLNSLWIKAVRKQIAQLLLKHTEWSQVTNGEDLLCTLPMVTNADRIVYLDETLYFYRRRSGSAVHAFSIKKFQSIKTVHQEFEKYIDLWQMPEMHPKHYAREVRGWLETLMILLVNRTNMESTQFHRKLNNIATDRYFLHAYALMDREELSCANKLLAKWLYDRKFIFLRIAAFFHKVKILLKDK